MSNQLSFPTQDDMQAISQHVLKKNNKNTQALENDALQWTRTAWENKMDYEISWLGMPIIQNPYDMILMQELIYRIRPDLIIETGVAHGGSIIYYSSLLQLMKIPKAEIVGIDIEIRKHNRTLIDAHPYSNIVTLIERSSVDSTTIEEVKAIADKHSNVLVILDSNHTHQHVLEELRLYQKFVSTNSYMVVFDTFMPKLAGLEGAAADFDTNTAWHAVQSFTAESFDFSIDKSMNKFYVSSCPDGFLKRVK